MTLEVVKTCEQCAENANRVVNACELASESNFDPYVGGSEIVSALLLLQAR